MNAPESRPPAPGRPPMHGARAAQRALRRLTTRAVDRRTKLGRELARWQAEIISDLGGPANVSTAQRTLLEMASRSLLLLSTLDAWLLARPNGILNKRRGCLIPAAIQRQALADSLLRTLQALGLRRVPHEAPSLSSYIASRQSPPVEPSEPSATQDMEPSANVAPEATGAQRDNDLPASMSGGLGLRPDVMHGDSPSVGLAIPRSGTLDAGGQTVEAMAKGQDTTPDRGPAEGLEPRVTPAGVDEVIP